MSARERHTKKPWIDPDDAPELTDDAWEHAQSAIGGTVLGPARGTLTRWFTEEELIERRKTAAASALTQRPNKKRK
jgi:hypothetical protein